MREPGVVRPTSDSGPIRVTIVAPGPVSDTTIGGISNFIRGFVKFKPSDFTIEIVGVAVGDGSPAREWQRIAIAGHDVLFLPVAHIATARGRHRVPVKARIVAGMLAGNSHINLEGRVVQLHSLGMQAGLLGRKAPRIRLVHSAPERLGSSRGESVWRRIGARTRLDERTHFSGADRVYFVNRETYERQSHRSPLDAGRFRFLPNGVDTAEFHALTAEMRLAERVRMAEEFAIPANVRWLLYVGRLDPPKDPHLLVRAFAAATSHGARNNTQLIVAGEGPLRASTESLAHELGVADRVRFIGSAEHPRVPKLMSACDALVVCSVFEGGPTVAFEALAAGLPVIATHVGEIPRIVRHGETGWIAEQRTPEALAAGIRWVLEDSDPNIAQICAESMSAYGVADVLAPLYEDHRVLAMNAVSRRART